MKSIRTRLFVAFTGFMIVFILCYSVFNMFFLDEYYIYRNKNKFIINYENIKEKFNNGENFYNLMLEIDRTYGIHSLIVAKDNLYTKYASFPDRDGHTDSKISRRLADFIRSKHRVKRDVIYDIMGDYKYDDKQLVYINELNSEYFIVLKKSINVIYESSAIATEFFMYAGLLILFIGCIIVYFYSKKMTKPIIEMDSVAYDIAHMKFDRKIEIQTKDELASLGESINLISEKLHTVINKLKEDIIKEKKIDDMRKTFMRNVSHELKTPIGIIKGYTEGLKYGVAVEKQEQYMNVIVDECDKMNNMLKDLLDLSNLELATFDLDKTAFEVCDVVKCVMEKFKPIFSERNITTQLKCEDKCIAYADYFRIEQVISNYFLNASNHVDSKRLIKVEVKKQGENIRVSVFNTGKNIPTEETEKIWKAFYKVDKARTRSYGGSGLGLSIVKAIIDQHNGIYGVENKENGVSFYFEVKAEK